MRRMQDQLTLIVNQIRSTYGNRQSMETASAATFTNALVDAGLIPESWRQTDASNNVYLANPYGGNITIMPDKGSASATVNDAINIKVTGVNKADCMKLASNMLGAGRTQGLVKINSSDINNTTVFSDIHNSVCGTGNSSTDVTFLFLLKTGT
jgi:hypothetical protein